MFNVGWPKEAIYDGSNILGYLSGMQGTLFLSL